MLESVSRVGFLLGQPELIEPSMQTRCGDDDAHPESVLPTLSAAGLVATNLIRLTAIMVSNRLTGVTPEIAAPRSNRLARLGDKVQTRLTTGRIEVG